MSSEKTLHTQCSCWSLCLSGHGVEIRNKGWRAKFLYFRLAADARAETARLVLRANSGAKPLGDVVRQTVDKRMHCQIDRSMPEVGREPFGFCSFPK